MILVTGGAGFIGSHLVEGLRRAGYEVVSLDIKGGLKVDILNYDLLLRAMKDADYVYHLAAVKASQVLQNPTHQLKVNLGGTVNVLEAARQVGVKRVLFASSEWVYAAANPAHVDERTPLILSKITHPYILAKIASEYYCHYYSQTYGVSFTILRYGITYGPRGETVISLFVQKALERRKITIHGDGSQSRNFVYIDDLVKGNILALKEVARNEIYNLCGPRKVSINEVVQTLNRIFNNSLEIEYEERTDCAYWGKDVSSEKARKDLGWQPRIGLEEGIRKCIRYLSARL